MIFNHYYKLGSYYIKFSINLLKNFNEEPKLQDQ